MTANMILTGYRVEVPCSVRCDGTYDVVADWCKPSGKIKTTLVGRYADWATADTVRKTLTDAARKESAQ